MGKFNPKTGTKIFFLLALLFFTGSNASAQQPTPSPTPKSTPAAIIPNGTMTNRRVTARRAKGDIKIDGRLDESDWQESEVVSNLRQQEPVEGAEASEGTEVRVLFDDKNLYVGVRAFDSEANKINARELVRDASFSNDDKVEILLDTYRDRRNAFRFAVNPLGVQRDALITDEGKNCQSLLGQELGYRKQQGYRGLDGGNGDPFNQPSF